ncbi:MAG TPA: patatin-like phospholipase family protein, partial [Microlunatus sp.]
MTFRLDEPSRDTETSNLPVDECDIVLQGGTASGVVYPRALAALARRYRLRGIGGTSAGAMAAAVAAAAEYGRTTGKGGFDVFADIPQELGRGRLLELFQPQRQTRTLLRLMLILTGGDRPNGRSLPNRVVAGLGTAFVGYLLPAVLGLLPGMILIILGILTSEPWAVVLGALLLVIIELAALLISIMINLTRDVPANSFGMCTGLTETGAQMIKPGGEPALTEWLSSKINTAAGLGPNDPPLSFGQLWTADSPGRQDPDKGAVQQVEDALTAALQDPRQRRIDLRMMTTCLSESRPYDLPFSAHRFFYD